MSVHVSVTHNRLLFVFMFQERKHDLKESLIHELEDKRRQVEHERNTMELLGGEPHE